ncbi:MAG TPA: type II toxin-antitoxin system prevent-host-death family antitoxin [Vicinamibacterales bacterium]
MKAMKVAEARARFGELLDAAEQGHEVVIERKGVWFRLLAESTEGAASPKTALFDFVDSAVMNGQWTWKPGKTGLAFAARRKKR